MYYLFQAFWKDQKETNNKKLEAEDLHCYSSDVYSPAPIPDHPELPFDRKKAVIFHMLARL
jgi:hypothetical protein